MAGGTTTIQITREASALLDTASKSTRFPKTYLADLAIKLFYDPDKNPNLEEALRELTTGQEQAHKDFVKRALSTEGRS